MQRLRNCNIRNKNIRNNNNNNNNKIYIYIYPYRYISFLFDRLFERVYLLHIDKLEEFPYLSTEVYID